MDEQLARLLVHPVLRYLELLLVQLLEHLLDRLVLLDVLDGLFGPDASDRVAVIAAEQNTEVDELETRQVRGLQLASGGFRGHKKDSPVPE